MLCVKQFSLLDFSCALIKVLLCLLYWDLSSFPASIYLCYFFMFLKYPPFVYPFLPQVSSSLSVSSFLCMTFALINLPVFPLGILFVYYFQWPEIREWWTMESGPVQADRQQTGCCGLLSEVAADRHFTSKSVSTNIKSSFKKNTIQKNTL